MIIKISFQSMGDKKVVTAKSKDSTVYLNSERTEYSFEEFANRVTELSKDWPEEIIKNSCDGLIVKLVILENGNKRKYTFINSYPENILNLQKLINEVDSHAKAIRTN